MNAPRLLNQIPDAQDIHGLLRRWSPAFLSGQHAGYRSAVADPEQLTIVGPEGAEQVEAVALDLTDPTGRWQAAWWATHRPGQSGYTGWSAAEWRARDCAIWGLDMSPEQIDTLARLVLRLAGRTS